MRIIIRYRNILIILKKNIVIKNVIHYYTILMQYVETWYRTYMQMQFVILRFYFTE